MSRQLSNILLLFVRAYQVALSPCLGGCCRFTPSCSEYATESLTQHRPHVAIWLITKRLLKCHPAGSFGYDPVPEKIESKRGLYGY